MTPAAELAQASNELMRRVALHRRLTQCRPTPTPVRRPVAVAARPREHRSSRRSSSTRAGPAGSDDESGPSRRRLTSPPAATSELEAQS
jgi:hypothetical protein